MIRKAIEEKDKKIAILGAGSIGSQTISVIEGIRKTGFDKYKLYSISGYDKRDFEVMKNALEHKNTKPKIISFAKEDAAQEFMKMHKDATIISGNDHLEKIVKDENVTHTVVAVSGAIGINATRRSLESSKVTCIATKEVLVAAGPLVMDLVKQKEKEVGLDPNDKLLRAIDSEHNAIWQCMRTGTMDEINKVIITASGGSLKNWDIDNLKDAKVEDVLGNHPTWKMGPKITVDSATMVNKALEIIEAHQLFGLPYEKIDYVIHPQSKIHSIVEYNDGSQISEMAVSDMRLPIQYALTYPYRLKTGTVDMLNKWDKLTFGDRNFMDPERYPAFHIALHYAKKGGHMPAIMNAANEIAVVEGFLNQDSTVGFMDIPTLIWLTCDKYEKQIKNNENMTWNSILNADKKARDIARNIIDNGSYKHSNPVAFAKTLTKNKN